MRSLFHHWKHSVALAVLGVALLVSAAHAQNSPTLIPFQGRLTDQQGNPYNSGQYSIVFQLYDQAVGGNLLWSERHERVGVLNGTVNIFLGSIAPLTTVDFSQVRHLGITIDVDNNPNTADSEMVPRQMIIPAFWAKTADNAVKLAGRDWSALLVNGNDPVTGSIRADKLQPYGITPAQVAPNSLTGNQIAPASVTGTQLAADTITAAHLHTSLALDTIIPPGTIQAFGGSNIPAGWLLCDGSTLSSSQYPRLYTAISTNWGVGTSGGIEGVNDFNVPDLRGLFLRGVNGTRSDSFADPDAANPLLRTNVNGGTKGNLVGSIQDSAIESHRHFMATEQIIQPQTPSLTSQNQVAYRGGPASDADYWLRGSSLEATWGRTSAYGGNETRPKNAYVNYIIKY